MSNIRALRYTSINAFARPRLGTVKSVGDTSTHTNPLQETAILCDGHPGLSVLSHPGLSSTRNSTDSPHANSFVRGVPQDRAEPCRILASNGLRTSGTIQCGEREDGRDR